MDSPSVANPDMYGLDSIASKITLNGVSNGKVSGDGHKSDGESEGNGGPAFVSSKPIRIPDGRLGEHRIGRKMGLATKVVEEEKAKEKHLGPGGDICGGIGGELGRRLEAWLHQNQHSPPVAWSGIGSPTLSRTVSFGE